MLCIVAVVMATPAEARRARITLAPYVWAPTITGRVSLGPLALPLRATPGQLASGVRAGVMGYASVERDRAFVATELIAVDFRRSRFAPVLSQDVAARAISVEGVAGYAVPLGRQIELRPFVGVRYNNLKVDVGTVPANLAVAGDWADPLLGGAVVMRPAPRVTLTLKADRGFGGADRHSFDIRSDVDYRFARRFSAFAGYRHAAQYYAGGKPAPCTIDLRGDGPIAGVRGRF